MVFRCLIIALALAGPGLAGGVELPDGYRGWPYKAPTPDSAPGATTLFFAEDVRALIERRAVLLVNVAPITLSPPGADGRRTWIPRRDHPEQQIPGSIWLPNVGYRALEPGMLAYFRDQLDRHTGGDRDHPILFYCSADCWMSWNAVKRSIEEFGYRDVYWYPYGTDGWFQGDYPLEPSVPVPFDGGG